MLTLKNRIALVDFWGGLPVEVRVGLAVEFLTGWRTGLMRVDKVKNFRIIHLGYLILIPFN